MVSKWIGETEKHLAQVFDAAEAGGAVLLFDEADALFGKRSEVKDSHDRYANIEVSYLLQRLESYRGLAVLATNTEQAVDAAFLRRLRCIVQFPLPDAGQRAAIWRRIFPPQTPTDGLGGEKLARLAVSGGTIRNIALTAAYLAADAGASGGHGASAAGGGDRVRQAPPAADRGRDGGLDVRVVLHIEELALHGFAAADRVAIGDAVQRELQALADRFTTTASWRRA